MPSAAIITGISGQDGSYLAERLVALGYDVVAARRSGNSGFREANHFLNRFRFHTLSVDSLHEWEKWLAAEQPDEFYHLAGMSFVPDCWRDPVQCAEVNYNWTATILEAIRKVSPKTRFVFACSSEVFGKPKQQPQNETTPFHPRTPYGISKAASHWLVESYRERYGLFATSAILFNHESPRRDAKFVSRKITQGVAAIEAGQQERLALGNLAVERDWGFAGEYVDAMQRMLALPEPQDFIIGTGKLTSLENLVKIAFEEAGLDWRNHVDIDPSLFRPTDGQQACKIVADASKARELLGWEAQVTPRELVRMMLDADRELLRAGRSKAA